MPEAQARSAKRCGAGAVLLTAALAGSLHAGTTGCIVVHPVDAPTSPNVSPGSSTPSVSPMPNTAHAPDAPSTPSAFTLKPDWDGPCARADAIDVNLGHTPESFVRAAHCQITGQQAPAKTVEHWAARLRQDTHLRRVDVVRALCLEQKRQAKLVYSDPWVSQPELLDAPTHRTRRDIGAVLMFFFGCPGGTNCGMDWANSHAPGMDGPSPLLGAKKGESGVYSPSEPGFWRHELLDAKYAGLQFFLLNTYGPDIADGKLAPLAKALASLDDPVKIALFDDTWTWGEPYFGDFWKQKPDLKDPERAARTIYEAKWKPFFSQIDKRYWYRFKGRPFVYFYNSGTLEPRERSAALVSKLKAHFKADFGEEPFVDVDGAYFADQDMATVADARFTWMTLDLGEKKSRSRLHGSVIDHAMVKWDAVGRDRPGEVATPKDRLIKDSAVLKRVLAESTDADVLVLATWNDLGEGTGVNRSYDYWAGGRWLEPDHFMRVIRESQSGGAR
jgi:hypothetical protein